MQQIANYASDSSTNSQPIPPTKLKRPLDQSQREDGPDSKRPRKNGQTGQLHFGLVHDLTDGKLPTQQRQADAQSHPEPSQPPADIDNKNIKAQDLWDDKVTFLGDITSTKVTNQVCVTQNQMPSEQEVTNTQQVKIRQFEHVEGQYATHVFFKVQLSSQHATFVAKAVNKLLPRRADLRTDELAIVGHRFKGGAYQADYHVSMSRVQPLMWRQISMLVKALISELRGWKGAIYSLGRPAVLCNDSATRTFVGLELRNCSNQICAAVRKVDKVLVKFGLERFYETPVFHVSFAWCSGDARDELRAGVEALTVPDATQGGAPASEARGPASQQSRQHQYKVDEICVRIGQKVYSIWTA